eukprot:scaffold12428_cov81-Skeletonema_marinoi.AAC.2
MTTFPPMPLLPITSQSTISACRELPLRPSDIFVCSYPKSGTTWTQHIVLTLLLADRKYKIADLTSCGNSDAGNTGDDLAYNHVSDYAPFFEIDAHWQSSSSTNSTKVLADSVRENHDRLGRRVFNTHLRWDMLPKQREASGGTPQNDDKEGYDADNTRSSDDNDSHVHKERPQCGKFIYVTRNQIDVVASFYHHLSNQIEGTYTDTFETFLKDWMDGKIPFGSSLHHLIGFAGGFADNLYDTSRGHDDIGDDESTGVTDQPLLLLSYEKMKSNLRTEVLRIISFLNLTHIPSHVLEEEILPSFGFSSMKNNIEKFQPKSVGWLNGFQFLRKGVTGDGRRLLLNRSTNDSGGGKEEGESSELMVAYNDWVEREEYRSKISNVLKGDCYEDCREVFLSVVEK